MPAYLRLLLTVLLPLLTLAAGCRREEAPPGVIARVGSVFISSDQLERYVQSNAGAPVAQLQAEAASALLDQLIEEVALVEQAQTAPEARPAPDAERRAAAIASIAAEVPPPTDEEIRRFYADNKGEFAGRERRRVRQILVREEALAKQIVGEIRGGVTFDEAARRYSRAPNAPRGGEVGWVERGQLPRIFEQAIFSLPAGSMSGILRTDSDFFHLFRVEEIAPGGEPSLDQVRPIIVERLREESVRQRIEQRISEFGARGGIRVLTDRLPFRYSGRWSRGE